jgi:uncharacterized membrane protein
VMVGIALLTTAALFPPLAYYYYLVIALPIAALVVRDPDAPPGAGIFDRFSAGGDRRRWVGLWISLAAAFSIAQIALPGLIVEEPVFGQFGTRGIIGKIPVAYVTTEIFTPFLWLIAVVAIIVSYTRRPARSAGVHDERPGEGALDGDAHASAGTSALSAEPSPQGEGSPA